MRYNQSTAFVLFVTQLLQTNYRQELAIFLINPQQQSPVNDRISIATRKSSSAAPVIEWKYHPKYKTFLTEEIEHV